MRWPPLAAEVLSSLTVTGLLLSAGASVACRQGGSTSTAPLGTAAAAVFPLRTEVEFDVGEATPSRVTVEGTGTLLFGRFVLTVAHAVTLDRLEATLRTPRGDITLPVEGRRLSEKTWLVSGERRVPLTPLARDAETDLALFSLPDGLSLPTFPYPIGESETLGLGDPIAVLGSDPEAGVLFRPGSVVALRGPALVASATKSKRIFLISMALTSGESGAPILAVRRGSYELVGLAQGTYVGPRQLAWAIRIDPALEAFSRLGDPALIRQFVDLCRSTQVATMSGSRDGRTGPETPTAIDGIR